MTQNKADKVTDEVISMIISKSDTPEMTKVVMDVASAIHKLMNTAIEAIYVEGNKQKNPEFIVEETDKFISATICTMINQQAHIIEQLIEDVDVNDTMVILAETIVERIEHSIEALDGRTPEQAVDADLEEHQKKVN